MVLVFFWKSQLCLCFDLAVVLYLFFRGASVFLLPCACLGKYEHEQVDELREALGTVEVNMVTNLVDPYCVAMATKTKVVSESE